MKITTPNGTIGYGHARYKYVRYPPDERFVQIFYEKTKYFPA